VQYGFGEVAGDTSKNRISASVTYLNGPIGLNAAVARDRLPLSFATEDEQAAYLVGAFYDFGPAKVFAQYAQTKQEFITPASDRKFKTAQIGAAVPLTPASRLLVSWGHTRIHLPATDVSAYAPTPAAPLPAGTPASGVDPKRNTLSVAYDYNLSKRTDIYTAFVHDKYTGLSAGKTAALGLRHKF
jgi:predicted porin